MAGKKVTLPRATALLNWENVIVWSLFVTPQWKRESALPAHRHLRVDRSVSFILNKLTLAVCWAAKIYIQTTKEIVKERWGGGIGGKNLLEATFTFICLFSTHRWLSFSVLMPATSPEYHPGSIFRRVATSPSLAYSGIGLLRQHLCRGTFPVVVHRGTFLEVYFPMHPSGSIIPTILSRKYIPENVFF